MELHAPAEQRVAEAPAPPSIAPRQSTRYSKPTYKKLASQYSASAIDATTGRLLTQHQLETITTPTQIDESQATADIPDMYHYAAAAHYVSSAINVDTGKLCEYRQLIKSSKGHLWEWSACE